MRPSSSSLICAGCCKVPARRSPAEHSARSDCGRLLVVDDNEMNRDLLSRRLRQQGHAVETAINGRSALEKIRAEEFDLVLLDVMMPELDGYQVLEQLKSDGSLYRVPVIMISAVSEIESVVRCIEMGATDYLPKPFNAVLLNARVGATLERKRLRDRERLYARSLERELEIGREIQASFLPETLPVLPGWEIAARFTPARQVAGDFYDAFPLFEGEATGLVIADVCGKGVGAALYMALFRSLLRAAAADEPPGSEPRPAATLARAIGMTNNYIAVTHSRANMFATLFFGILDPKAGLVSYINAGHESPMVVGPSGVAERLGPTGPAVGLFPDKEFVVAEARLSPGATLFTFTDGVTEAQNASGAFYTEERLLSLLEQGESSAAGLLDRVESSVAAFIGGAERSDDLTLLAVKRESRAKGGIKR